MSDPMTNLEIEDVLSSIRRLVSEELRPIPRVTPLADAGKLVLTPAYRVSERDESPELAELPSGQPGAVPPVEPQPDAVLWLKDAVEPDAGQASLSSSQGHDMPAAQPVTDRSALEATISELEAAVAARDEDWEPDGSEVAASTPQPQLPVRKWSLPAHCDL